MIDFWHKDMVLKMKIQFFLTLKLSIINFVNYNISIYYELI